VPWLALLSLLAPAAEPRRFDFSGAGMATTFRLAFYAADAETAAAAADACFRRIAELNARCTDYDPASELMRLCAPDTAYPQAVSPDLLAVLQRARELAAHTDGAFDPTCGHLSQLWRRAKRQGKLPPPDRLQQALAATDWRRLQPDPSRGQVTLKPGTLLDLGGIAKGFAADACLRLLRELGLTGAEDPKRLSGGEIRRAAIANYNGKRGEIGWVLDDNQGMNAIADAINSKVNKEYRIYEKGL